MFATLRMIRYCTQGAVDDCKKGVICGYTQALSPATVLGRTEPSTLSVWAVLA